MKKFVTVAIAATVLATASLSGAQAAGRHHRHGHHNPGAMLAFGIGATALGIIAASQNRIRECWYERDVYFDKRGRKHVEKVRVCR